MVPLRGFVDCHSHLAPTGDDGARSVEEGVGLARDAAAAGTAVLYCTPHVWDDLPMHPAREARFRDAVAEMRARLGAAGPELRIGFELTPAPALLDEDPRRYLLQGTQLCLVETPFAGGLAQFWRLAEHVAAAGLTPLVAHPERSMAFSGGGSGGSGRLDELLERGWPVQVTGASVSGRNGHDAERTAFRILQRHEATVVASDGHRAYRPATLDAAWAVAVARLGEERTEHVFGGAGIAGLTPGAGGAAA